jgi:hypothetical protein
MAKEGKILSHSQENDNERKKNEKKKRETKNE